VSDLPRNLYLLSIAGVNVPSIMGLVPQDLGPRAGLAYRYLSAVAHGVLWGLMRMSVVMETPAGGAVKPQTDLLNVIAFAGEAVAQVFRGFNAQVRLYGWDMDEWKSWTVEAGRAIHRLALEQAEGPG
jgi:hypothetical protein